MERKGSGPEGSRYQYGILKIQKKNCFSTFGFFPEHQERAEMLTGIKSGG